MGAGDHQMMRNLGSRLRSLPPGVFAGAGAALVAVIVLAAYAPSFGRWFFRDDFFYLSFSRYNWSLADPLRFLTDTHNGLFTPLGNLFFYLQYQVFAFQAGGYRLVSLALHALNACLTGLFVYRLERQRWAALLAALLFAATFSIQEAVSWIAAGAHLLSLTFCLLALLFAARWITRQCRRDLLLSAVLLIPALFVKEDAISFPVVLCALVGIAALRRQISRRAMWTALAIYGAQGLLYGLWLLYWHNRPDSIVQLGQFTMGLHGLTNYRYLIGLLIPPPDYIPFVSLINRLLPGFVLRLYAVVGWTLLLPLALFLLWRLFKGSLVEQLAVVWIGLTFAPFSMSTIGISMRYLYIPYAGFAILLGLMLGRLMRARRAGWVLVLLSLFLIANIAGTWVWNMRQSRDTAEKQAIIHTLQQDYDAGLVEKKQICVVGLPRAISDVTIAVPVFTSRQPRPEVYMDAVFCPAGAFLYQYADGQVTISEP